MLRFLLCLALVVALALAQCSCPSCPCQNADSCPAFFPAGGGMYFGATEQQAPCGVSGYFQLETTAVIEPDSFTVLTMDQSNLTALLANQPYSWYQAWSDPYSTFSCYDSSLVWTSNPGFFVVVLCNNTIFDCRVKFNLGFSPVSCSGRKAPEQGCDGCPPVCIGTTCYACPLPGGGCAGIVNGSNGCTCAHTHQPCTVCSSQQPSFGVLPPLKH